MIVVAALGLSVVSYVIHVWSLLSFPYDIDPGEGFDVNGAVLILAGRALYGDPSSFPFFGLNYPPVYGGLLAPLVALLGPSVSVGRLVSVLAGVGIAIVVGLAARVPRPVPLAPLVAGLAFLTSAYAFHVTPLARVTSLMLFLGVAGLFCLERAAESPGSAWRRRRPGGAGRQGGNDFVVTTTRRARDVPLLLAGVALLVAGVYTKPVGLDAAAAGLVYLAVRRPPDWPLAIVAALSLLVGLHLTLEWGTAGRYGDAVFTANAYAWDGEQALGYWRNFLETHAPLLALGAAAAAGHVMSRWFTVWVFYLGSGLVTAATAGRWGAGESYFLPIVIACCVLGGRALAWSTTGSRRGELLVLGAFGLFVVSGGVGPWPLRNLVPAWDRGFQAHALGHDATPADWTAGDQIVAFAAAARGPVLSEAAGFVLAGGGEVVGNPMLLRGLSNHGLYDVGPLTDALRGHAIRRVILLGQWYPPEVLQVIGERYVQVGRVEVAGNVYLLYEPRE